MKMRGQITLVCFVLCFAMTLSVSDGLCQGAYEATWESLKNHDPAPDWFRDAKFGIYFHWGVYSVPAFGNEWYPRWMLFENQPHYKHHVETYGDPSEFGYHDFVPMFKAENFDADEWADLFEKAGAKYAGPVAEHHDGFSMWASKVNPWNVKDMGPERDITGEIAAAVRKRGMKVVTSFHHARNLQRHNSPGEPYPHRHHYRNSHYPPFEKYATTSEDPLLRILYGNIPEDKFLENWKGKLFEVIDNYRPDLIWFDSWLDLIPEADRLEFLAYYLNSAAEWGKEVVVTNKQDDMDFEVTVLDIEKGRLNELTDYAWLTDDTISKGSWCYTEDLDIKSTPQVLHVLIDIVSKNGQLLLNISPKADGTIPEVQKKVLLGIGEWLGQYGEAIYETRPWLTFGEGPTRLKKGGGFTHQHSGYLQYTVQDIRYTSKGNTIYAIVLGCPGAGDEVRLETFAKEKLLGDLVITKVSMLGADETVEWAIGEYGLVLNAPDKKGNEMAVVFKIETTGTATLR